MGQLHIRVVFADAGDDLPPQLADFQHVAFVHAAQAPTTLLGTLERHPRDTLHLRTNIRHGDVSLIELLTGWLAGGMRDSTDPLTTIL